MNCSSLPQNYEAIRTIDMQKDKRLAIAISMFSLVLWAVMMLLGFFLHPKETVTLTFTGASLLLRLAIVLAGSVLYICLHELIHGVFIKHYSGEKPQYGFKGFYAYAGSDKAYFDRKSYIVIALAPVILLGLLLLVLNLLLPARWFWMVYWIQALNISGAAGDLYVTRLIMHMPRNVLVQDTGVSMTFYAPFQKETPSESFCDYLNTRKD
ncbi:MAG: DUF3267 domain-containing protein [Christensenellales bacterium]|jgi:hypothetical protein